MTTQWTSTLTQRAFDRAQENLNDLCAAVQEGARVSNDEFILANLRLDRIRARIYRQPAMSNDYAAYLDFLITLATEPQHN